MRCSKPVSWVGVAVVFGLYFGGGCTRASTHSASTRHDSVIAISPLAALDAGSWPEQPILVAPHEKPTQLAADAGAPLEHSVPARPLSERVEPGYANDDPTDDGIVGPPDIIADCEQRLTAAEVTFRSAKLPIRERKGFSCGTEQAVVYVKGPESMRFEPAPVVSCGLALALARFERVLNRTAKEFLGTRVVAIVQGGTYNCRSMARFRLVSEHSYANAIDLYGFRLADGRRVSVLRDFGSPREPAKTRESRFLRELAHRLYDEQVFSVVVTRFFDELHRDHIHVDMARYRTDGSR